MDDGDDDGHILTKVLRYNVDGGGKQSMKNMGEAG